MNKKSFYSIILLIVIFSSCFKKNEQKKSKTKKENINKNVEIKKSTDICDIDSLEMHTSEFNGIDFYTENTIRGKGVVIITVNQKLEMLNLDKTLFGNIDLINKGDSETFYKINLPKKIIAREVLPNEEFQIFNFDAEIPEDDSDYIVIYVNKEKKLIKKNTIKYSFESWEKYIKSSFIELSPNTKNVKNDEKLYWYEVLEIKGDSMKMRSVNKSSCDYIEHYKDVTIWIKWKEDNCKLVKFNFCY